MWRDTIPATRNWPDAQPVPKGEEERRRKSQIRISEKAGMKNILLKKL